MRTEQDLEMCACLCPTANGMCIVQLCIWLKEPSCSFAVHHFYGVLFI